MSTNPDVGSDRRAGGAEAVEGTSSTAQDEPPSIDLVDVDYEMPLVMPPGSEDERLADHSAAQISVVQTGETS